MTDARDNPLSLEAAKKLDAADRLAPFRDQFWLPGSDKDPEIYFVGNSLGLMPKITADFVRHEMEQWRTLGVRGHFEGEFPWMPYHEFLADEMAKLVAARPHEVVVMNGLTVNLHLMMASFFKPEKQRTKILIERHAFPSDSYAVSSRLQMSGLDPEQNLIVLEPDEGELFSAAHVCETIAKNADTLAMVILPGVQYYTGQVLAMKEIAAAARKHGIVVGLDLAHAVGNVELALHDWDVDFAVWCTYKYLNAGPGAVAGCFVHERHARNTELKRLAGWWGQDKATRFEMKDPFQPIPTAEGWQLSNPPILAMAAVRASMEVFRAAGGMKSLREKSLKLTGLFADLIKDRLGDAVNVITPLEEKERGCQLSLEIAGGDGQSIYHALEESGVRTDWRDPNVIRAAPVPLYNSFEEVWRFVDRLSELI